MPQWVYVQPQIQYAYEYLIYDIWNFITQSYVGYVYFPSLRICGIHWRAMSLGYPTTILCKNHASKITTTSSKGQHHLHVGAMFFIIDCVSISHALLQTTYANIPRSQSDVPQQYIAHKESSTFGYRMLLFHDLTSPWLVMT